MLVGLQHAHGDATGAGKKRLEQHQPHQAGRQGHLRRVEARRDGADDLGGQERRHGAHPGHGQQRQVDHRRYQSPDLVSLAADDAGGQDGDQGGGHGAPGDDGEEAVGEFEGGVVGVEGGGSAEGTADAGVAHQPQEFVGGEEEGHQGGGAQDAGIGS
jgi:hypothetical protein